MKIINRIFESSLGKKYIMAVTGFVLFLFVLGHMAGNLQVFLGPEAINRYGLFKGGWMTAKRIGRCHPFYHGNLYDPVPERD